MSNPAPDFPTRLRQARERLGLSQADLANRARLQPSAISHFETGRRAPSFDNLRRLADALGVTTDYLLSRNSSPGLTGPQAEQLFRDASKLSASDLDTLARMAQMLAAKEKEPKRPR